LTPGVTPSGQPARKSGRRGSRE